MITGKELTFTTDNDLSKRLMNAGIPPSSADLLCRAYADSNHNLRMQYLPAIGREAANADRSLISWSFERLRLMTGCQVLISRDGKKVTLIGVSIRHPVMTFKGRNTIEAMTEAVIWLKLNNLLNTH